MNRSEIVKPSVCPVCSEKYKITRRGKCAYCGAYLRSFYWMDNKNSYMEGGGDAMPGRICTRCGEPTFFMNNMGGRCTKCGFTMTLPANDGKGGRGSKCINCGKLTVFDNKCRNCGAIYK